MAIHLDEPVASQAPDPRWWRPATILLAAAIFMQAVFAGAMLSGFDWARAAHAANALVVVVASAAASLAATVTLRRSQNGRRLAFVLFGLTVVVLVQFVLGRMAAKGANLMWAHVPLGVMLAGFAGQAVAGARKLGEER